MPTAATARGQLRLGTDKARRCFKRLKDSGVLRRADAVAAVETFIELCLGWRWRKQIWSIAPAPSQAEIDAMVEAAVDVFMRGYGKP